MLIANLLYGNFILSLSIFLQYKDYEINCEKKQTINNY